MAAERLAAIRQLVEAATPEPAIGLDWRELYITTDDAHRCDDGAFYRQARAIVLELLDEVAKLGLVNALLRASIDQLTQIDAPHGDIPT
jgi:hypothetical protein